jgi:hypothetical protein
MNSGPHRSRGGAFGDALAALPPLRAPGSRRRERGRSRRAASDGRLGIDLPLFPSPALRRSAGRSRAGRAARGGRRGIGRFLPNAVGADPASPSRSLPALMKRPNSGRGATGSTGGIAGLPRRRRNASRGHRAPVARSCSHPARATPASSDLRLTARGSICHSGGRPARWFTATPREGADRNRPETAIATCGGRDRSCPSPAAGSSSNDQRLEADLYLGRCAVRPGFAA